MLKNKKHIFSLYIHEHKIEWLMLCIFILFTFLLYILVPDSAQAIVLYFIGAEIIFALFYFFISFQRRITQEKRFRLIKREAQTGVLTTELLEGTSRKSFAAMHENLLQKILQEKHFVTRQYERKQAELVEYYTRWVHQTKTPITALQLLLEVSEDPNKHLLEQELFKIEQYVDVALQYQRIQATSRDFVFMSFQLEEVVREVIKKMSLLFIYKKIHVEVLVEAPQEIVSDKKWVAFMLEQLISNAIKYTQAFENKKVIIRQERATLFIEDEGIGISGEMLPRITQWSFTGENGRMNKSSTGIGLALSAKVAQELQVQMNISSKQRVGTTVKLIFPTTKIL